MYSVQCFVREKKVGYNSMPVNIFEDMTLADFRRVLDNILRSCMQRELELQRNELKPSPMSLKSSYVRRVIIHHTQIPQYTGVLNWLALCIAFWERA